MTPDECIAAMWDIENACDDGDGVTFDARSDMWWVVSVFCGHSDWSRYGKDAAHIDYATVQVSSGGPCDLADTFVEALARFRVAHGLSRT